MGLTLTTRVWDQSVGHTIESPIELDPSRTAIIIVDPWDFHWCMTTSNRVGALVSRWNRALSGFRSLGMQVLWAPTEAASQYAGWPQRERAAATELLEVPRHQDVEIPFTVKRGKCMCGPGIACAITFGFGSAICPGVVIDDRNLIVSGAAETYSICRHRRIQQVLYMGLSTNICLAGRPEGVGTMRAAGIRCIVCRDMDDAFTYYEPARFTPDDGSAIANADLERAGIPTISAADELRRLGTWDDRTPVDPVRFTPWGKPDRPYLFDESVAVTLTFPNDPSAVIRFTSDGSEPTAESSVFTGPIHLKAGATIRATAFRDGQSISLPSEGVFLRLPPVSPAPDVFVDEVPRIREDYPHWYSAWQPVMNLSFERTPLRAANDVYARGVGMRAPANLRLALMPEYKRFVASVGVDAGCIAYDADHYGFVTRPVEDVWDGHGELYAQVANVRFRVFIDGNLVAESPALRTGQVPWRFDVPIPAGAKQINLVTIDAGRRSELNYGDWLNAGFITRSTAS